MRLMLDEDTGIPIPLDNFALEAWTLQYIRALNSGRMESLMDRLATSFATSLAECLDADLKRPSDAKVQYATSIARELGIALPAEALRFRGPMDDFIDRFAEQFRQRHRDPHTEG
ncbi:hypothetical protein B1806_09640 [Metallibacterium scheffleri]|uniref:Uncharacterized protein n=1 Tax=Metallibacterium scheffleri TaxID=993689 RepID=A0A4S3KMV5_9GAMM|nr:hypothetical protein B1806_09640 [Metallibacterium scheffleri]